MLPEEVLGLMTNLLEIFQNIKTGLSMAATNQQKMNVISHFSKQLQQQILPLLNSPDVAPPKPQDSAPIHPQSDPIQTASAQPGHPTLSINGTANQHPGQSTISGVPHGFVPVVPI